MALLPVDPASQSILVVAQSASVAPYTYVNGVKIDANGAVVVSG